MTGISYGSSVSGQGFGEFLSESVLKEADAVAEGGVIIIQFHHFTISPFQHMKSF